MSLNDYSSESGSYLKIELRNGVSGKYGQPVEELVPIWNFLYKN